MSNVSDVMIHLNGHLSEAAQYGLEERMREVEGVISPRFTPGRDNLLMVAFDPDVAHCDNLISKVREAGYSGHMIGL